MTERRLRILLDIEQLPAGRAGGIEQFAAALIWGLGRLGDGGQEYIVLADRGQTEWLEPLVGSNQKIVSRTPPLDRAKAWLGPLRRPAGRVWRTARGLLNQDPEHVGPAAAGPAAFVEALRVDVVHIPFQKFRDYGLPTVFNPHDLLHLHHPEFFTAEELDRRQQTYGWACRRADAVVAESEAAKNDIIAKFGLDERKVYVIYRASPTALYGSVAPEMLAAARRKFHLPDVFALYPAQTWPHKNHIRLLEALALLRQRHGVNLTVVCTGWQNEWWPTIERQIRDLDLGAQILFLGYLPAAELRALYRLARFLVFPSLFEGGGFPLLEAFHEGVPVACSNIAPLRECGAGATLEFDPNSASSIASALLRMVEDGRLLSELRQRGSERIARFTWEKTARKYRALYRRVAGEEISEADVALLRESLPSESAGQLGATC